MSLPPPIHWDPWAGARLEDEEFDWLAARIRQVCGIALGPSKRTMLEGRLRRRLRALELDSFAEYVDLLADPVYGQGELAELVDAVVTNQTAFFRERAHFDYLAEEGLARLAAAGAGRQGPLQAWSAACSSGEEAWSLAMLLAEAAPALLPRGFAVLGTDIARGVLEQARRAIYPESAAAPIPPDLRRRHLLRSRDRGLGLVRIAPELRERVRFEQRNLLDPHDHPPSTFDLVFCRNVLIYFRPEDQRRVLLGLCRHLRPGGILCLGHTDSIAGLTLPLRPLRVNVHERV